MGKARRSALGVLENSSFCSGNTQASPPPTRLGKRQGWDEVTQLLGFEGPFSTWVDRGRIAFNTWDNLPPASDCDVVGDLAGHAS